MDITAKFLLTFLICYPRSQPLLNYMHSKARRNSSFGQEMDHQISLSQ